MSDTGSGLPRLPPGTPVEVWVRYDEAWVPGFTVADAGGSGYRVQRSTDGTVLPVELDTDDVRVAHRGSSTATT